MRFFLLLVIIYNLLFFILDFSILKKIELKL